MTYVDEVAELLIRDTCPEDAGQYRCEANNVIGIVETQGTLAVHGKLLNQ